LGKCNNDPPAGREPIGSARCVTLDAMQWVRNVLKKILPDRFIEWYRRKRAVRQYIGSL
jgi:hypothetical protein